MIAFKFEIDSQMKFNLTRIIRIIHEHTFEDCNRLEIPSNLDLQVFQDEAFSKSSFSSI